MFNFARSLRRLRGAVGMALLWAVAWAAAGLGIGVFSVVTPFLPWDDVFRYFDAPLPALAVPGFIVGLLFSGVLRVAARRRPLASLSTRLFSLWGAIGGLLLACIPDLMVATGLATLNANTSASLWQLTAIIATPLVVLSSVSAAVSFQLAKRIPDPLPLEGHEEMLALVRELEQRPRIAD